MKKVVIYSTTYGSTQKYATKIANQLQCSAVQSDAVTDELLADADIIIIGSCLLEGKLEDASIYEKWITAYSNKRWLLFTVGLSNPELTNFQEILAHNFSSEIIQALKTFHFRGAIQYKRMLLMSSLVSKLIKKDLSSVDEVPLSESNKRLLNRYGTSSDSSDEASTASLIEYVAQIENNKENH